MFLYFFFFFKQKTAYEMRISDWSSDVCSSDLLARQEFSNVLVDLPGSWTNWSLSLVALADAVCLITEMSIPSLRQARRQLDMLASQDLGDLPIYVIVNRHERSEEHTSELQSLMRI